MQVEEAVVLAGGLGTRLRSEVSDVPKPMAPVAGRPFLEFLLGQLASQGLKRVILSVGYKYEIIEQHFGTHWHGLDLEYCVEASPLGTGGALREAFAMVEGDLAFALNGDTVLDERFERLIACQAEHDADLALFVREIEDGGRYGVCDLDGDRLTGFSAGDAGQPASINAGSYLVRRELMRALPTPSPFSFETESMPAIAAAGGAWAVRTKADFIDIGVPDSYRLAQSFIPAIGL